VSAVARSCSSKGEAFVPILKNAVCFPPQHLALAMLSDESCTLEVKVEALFEQYRKMAVGKQRLSWYCKQKHPTRNLLKKANTNRFGSSWCPKCTEEIPLLKDYYQHWQEDYDLEVVLISLDTDPKIC
jgi:thiol-disulfide isomerase/thioredoxin